MKTYKENENRKWLKKEQNKNIFENYQRKIGIYDINIYKRKNTGQYNIIEEKDNTVDYYFKIQPHKLKTNIKKLKNSSNNK